MTIQRLQEILKKSKAKNNDQVVIATWDAHGGDYWFLQENCSGIRREGGAVMIGHFDRCQAHNAKHIFK